MSFVDKIILPGGGRKYSGTNSKGLIWLKNKAGLHFPNHMIRKSSATIILYCHGNGGSLGDFKSIVGFYAHWFNSSIFAVEYPSYGPAEGEANEASVNDNVKTSLEFLLQLGYPMKNIIMMGYSIGTGPTIKIASELCQLNSPPGAVITVAAFLSVCDIVRDLQKGFIVSLFADAIANRWNSGAAIKDLTCPLMLVHGMIDDIIPYTHSEKLFQLCPSSSKRLRLVPLADHVHFEEPVDTVQPIANFIKEIMRPDYDVDIKTIPLSFYDCPKSIQAKELSNKKKGQNDPILDTAREGCTALGGVVSWFGEVGLAVVTGGTYVVSSTTSAVVDPLFGGGKEGAGENIENYTGTITLPSPSKETSPVFGSQTAKPAVGSTPISTPVDGVSVFLPGSPMTPQSSSTVAESDAYSPIDAKQAAKDATITLTKYFDSLNRHDAATAVSYLDKDVAARFSEDARRNWSSRKVATEKYIQMFKDMPDLKVKYQFLKISHEDAVTNITTLCQFSSAHMSMDIKRTILFIISRDKRIVLMDHNS